MGSSLSCGPLRLAWTLDLPGLVWLWSWRESGSVGTDVRAGAARGGPVLRGPAACGGGSQSSVGQPGCGCWGEWKAWVCSGLPGALGRQRPRGQRRWSPGAGRTESLGVPRGCGSPPQNWTVPGAAGPAESAGPEENVEPGFAGTPGFHSLAQRERAGSRVWRKPLVATGVGRRRGGSGAAFAGARGTEAVAPEAGWGLWSRQAEPEAWRCGRLPGVWGHGSWRVPRWAGRRGSLQAAAPGRRARLVLGRLTRVPWEVGLSLH